MTDTSPPTRERVIWAARRLCPYAQGALVGVIAGALVDGWTVAVWLLVTLPFVVMAVAYVWVPGDDADP